ncbi:hypothetical protein SAVIM338S_01107 [Streptomyces avidinii]
MITRLDRAVGAVLGSAAGDALGAPYEFGPAGQLTERGAEMLGGGGWEPGEATDDTQMAVLVGESLLERGGLELPDVFDRFRRWAAADPKDIGLQTEDVLTNGEPWDLGRLFRILPGPRRPAPHLAALPGHPSTSSTREPRQHAEPRHRTTRA